MNTAKSAATTNTHTALRRSSLDDQLLSAIKQKSKPAIRLEADENGNIIIDREKHPQVYDWALNG